MSHGGEVFKAVSYFLNRNPYRSRGVRPIQRICHLQSKFVSTLLSFRNNIKIVEPTVEECHSGFRDGRKYIYNSVIHWRKL